MSSTVGFWSFSSATSMRAIALCGEDGSSRGGRVASETEEDKPPLSLDGCLDLRVFSVDFLVSWAFC